MGKWPSSDGDLDHERNFVEGYLMPAQLTQRLVNSPWEASRNRAVPRFLGAFRVVVREARAS